MKTITLPNELLLDTSLSISVFDYQSTQEISKQQIILDKNTFSFLREGTKEVFFDNSSFSIHPDQFLLMKTGHCLMTEKLSDEHNNYGSVLLFFTNDMVLKFMRKYAVPKGGHGTFPSVYSFKYDSFIQRFVSSLLDINQLSKTAQKNLLETKFEEIMLYLIEIKGVGFLHSIVSNHSDENQKFIQTIENNHLNKLTLKELAFLCNMSESSFKRAFKKHYAESPMKWFQDKRLEHAQRLLKEEGKRPSDIFFQVGYDNLSSFVQAYKAKFGITPKRHQNS
jgi:AraC-like DNA-binding protein